MEEVSPTMVKTVAAVFLFCSALLLPQTTFSQPRQDIGNFDINKVARDVAGQETTLATTDTAKAAVAMNRFAGKTNENWTLVSLRIGLYLMLTIAAIFLVIWGIKRIGFAGRSKIGGGSMDVLEALPLGQNRNIVLVRVVDKVYLIGQTQSTITVLETIEGQKALELISSTKGVVSMAQFKDVFNNFMGKFKK
jgi:flagellar biosynthetic protein FliO